MKKILCIILLSALFLSLTSTLVSCGNETVSSETTTQDTDTTQPVEEVVVLPEDAFYGGYEYKIHISGNMEYNDFDDSKGLEGSTLEVARYKRNSWAETQFGIDITETTEFIFNGANGNGPGYKTFSNMYMSSSYDYDAGLASTFDSAMLAANGYLSDLNDVPYIDLTKSWWDQKANEQLSINGQMYFSTGDISTVDNVFTQCILFSKVLIDEKQLQNPYQLVKDNKWDMDTLASEIKKVSEDVNGDSEMTPADKYGLLTWNDSIQEFLAASGEAIAKINDDGKLELTVYNQRTSSAIDKFFGILDDNTSAINYQAVSNTTGDWNSIRHTMFDENRVAYYMSTFNAVADHRAKETDFGILPFPKLDLEQESYGHIVAAFHSQMYILPAFMESTERTGAITEGLAWYGKEILTPAYYDQTLVGQIIRDDESAEMLDIIFSTHVFDAGVIYDTGYSGLLISMAKSLKNTFSSVYNQNLNSAEQRISEFNKNFEVLLNEKS
jgi:uncharacterized membrane protein